MEQSEQKIKNRLANLRRFGKEIPVVQPTPEQKKAGWERRRQRLAIMDTLTKYMNLSKKQFFELIENINTKPDKYTMQDVILAQYVTKASKKDNFLLDWIDRHVEKAPRTVQLTDSDGEELIKNINITIREPRSDESIQKELPSDTEEEDNPQ